MPESSPFIWLSELLEDPDMLKPPTAIAPRVVWSNRVTLLAAREKTGKSTLAGAAAAAVSTGKPFLDGECIQGNVLIVALEEHPQEFSQRLVKFGADPSRIAIVQGGTGTLVADIRATAEEIEPKLIIWDTLGAFANEISDHPIEPNDSSGWTRVMLEIVNISREYGASLLLHHSNKSDGKYRDSTAIGANADVIIEMYGDDDNPRTLKTKARFDAPEVKIKLEGSEFSVLDSDKQLQAKVVEFVKKNPKCSFNMMAKGVGGNAEALRKARNAAEKDGRILQIGTGSNFQYIAAKNGVSL